MSTEHLFEAGFPKIEICLSPGFDNNFIKKMGYKTITNFAKGIGEKDGKPFFGWNGNKSTDMSELFEMAFMFKNFSNIVQKYKLYLDDAKKTNCLKIKERKFRYPDGKCFDIIVDIDPADHKTKVIAFIIYFKEVENITVHVKISDPHREHFLSDMFSFSGAEIKKILDPSHDKTIDIYRVQINENIDIEEDQETNCKRYQKQKNESFKQCVKILVEEKFKEEIGCIPPWFVESVDDICDKSYTEKYWGNMIFPTLDNTFLEVSCGAKFVSDFLFV